jgi:hypothetical protein
MAVVPYDYSLLREEVIQLNAWAQQEASHLRNRTLEEFKERFRLVRLETEPEENDLSWTPTPHKNTPLESKKIGVTRRDASMDELRKRNIS